MLRLLVYIVVVALVLFVVSYGTGRWAQEIGRPFGLWAVAGVLLGPMAWLGLAFLTVADQKSSES